MGFLVWVKRRYVVGILGLHASVERLVGLIDLR